VRWTHLLKTQTQVRPPCLETQILTDESASRTLIRDARRCSEQSYILDGTDYSSESNTVMLCQAKRRPQLLHCVINRKHDASFQAGLDDLHLAVFFRRMTTLFLSDRGGSAFNAMVYGPDDNSIFFVSVSGMLTSNEYMMHVFSSLSH